jgi:hypothetical protein
VHPSTPPADAHRRLPSTPLRPPLFRSHHYRLSVHMPRCAAPCSRLAGSAACVQTRLAAAATSPASPRGRNHYRAAAAAIRNSSKTHKPVAASS